MVKQHTPMMQQYLNIKNNYPNMLVMFRMGDFYEFFFDDAVISSKLLGITLTSRGQSAGDAVKMAGVPFHAVEQYLSKLINNGHSVVIVDQVGEVNHKAPIERKVTKIITPGTLTEISLLDAKKDNILSCIHLYKNFCGIASMSIVAGSFIIDVLPITEVQNTLARICPNEILTAYQNKEKLIKMGYTGAIKIIDDWNFDLKISTKLLLEHFKINSLNSFGINTNHDIAIIAGGVLLNYAKTTQCNGLSHINKINLEKQNNILKIDSISRNNLEINSTIRGEKHPTLFSSFDFCSTTMGSRKLSNWFNNPILSHQEINTRLDAVTILIEHYQSLDKILENISDIERITSRIALKSVRPKELIALLKSLQTLPKLNVLNKYQNNRLLKNIIDSFNANSNTIAILIEKALKPEPNNFIRDGDVINDGYNLELDRLRDIQLNINKYLQDLELKERTSTGISNLKIEYNRIHGFYIEISNSNLDKIPKNYRRTQTLKNVERFITPELKQFENEILAAQDQAINLEKILYDKLLDEITIYTTYLQNIANNIAILDVLNNFAKCAKEYNYCRPQLVNSHIIEIQSGRHPVIERQINPFICNDLNISSKENFLIITGPNMGGKSTFMRQNALIVLLAYCGSYVPAKNATIGIVDQIFTRIGASDDLNYGKSTFMVEMIEAANILNNATNNSLVLFDEIGRGTSTFDGLSLAYAISCFMIEKICSYSLFATHYFELVNLEKKYSNVVNLHVSALENNDEIIFLHQIHKGYNKKSYGIQVAALAGIPTIIIKNAKKYLLHLEKQQQIDTKDLFTIDEHDNNNLPTNHVTIIDTITGMNPDNLSPKQALNILYELHNQLNDKTNNT